MPDMMKYLIDAAVGAALFFALLIVFAVDFFFFKGDPGPGENTLTNVKVLGGEKKGNQKKLRLAVTPSGKTPKAGGVGFDLWDDMGKLLDELGEGFKYEEIDEASIISKHEKGTLNDYDVIFLTCSGGILDKNKLKVPLFDYVAKGGILYASDWRFDTIAAAFPNVVVPNLIGQGVDGTLQADVMDRDLKEILGEKVDLRFDLAEWKTAAFGGARVKTLLQGKYTKYKPKDEFGNQIFKKVEATAPLMVKFQVDKGTVIFTSFHNEKQNSRTEKQLLHYLVFSLVTAGVDAEVNMALDKEGFTPQRSNLLSAPSNQKVEKKYDNDHVSNLRFALGFRGEQGIKLRFNIKAPDGRQFTKDCESTTVLEVSSAEKGMWTYSVTALNAYANFPFTLTVGEKK